MPSGSSAASSDLPARLGWRASRWARALARSQLQGLGDELIELPTSDGDETRKANLPAVGDGHSRAAPADVHVERRHFAVFGPPVQVIECPYHRQRLGVDADRLKPALLQEIDILHDVLSRHGEADDFFLGLAVAVNVRHFVPPDDDALRRASHLHLQLTLDQLVQTDAVDRHQLHVLNQGLSAGDHAEGPLAFESSPSEGLGQLGRIEIETALLIQANGVRDGDLRSREQARLFSQPDLQQLQRRRAKVDRDRG